MAAFTQGSPVCFWFTGNIDSVSAPRICRALFAAHADGVSEIHLSINSLGGIAEEGLSVYTAIRSISTRVVTYNAGCIQSAAVVAFLGADERYCAQHASFLIHPVRWLLQQGVELTAEQANDIRNVCNVGDKVIDAVLLERVPNLPEQLRNKRFFSDVAIGTEKAIEYGLVQGVRPLPTIPGQQVHPI